jgi:short-subunit dehydrogenase
VVRSVTSPQGCCAVLGVGPGLGTALARRFGDGGYPVALVARGAGRLEGTVDALTAVGITARAFASDLSVESEVNAAMVAIEDLLGPVDVLIYNAATLGVLVRPTELTLDLLYSSFRVDVVGALLACQHVAPGMQARGTGTILFTSGTAAVRPMPELCTIGACKAALRNLSFNLADELGPYGVHVATVMVGGVIAAGTAFAPEVLAELFWDVHQQPPGQWATEVRW